MMRFSGLAVFLILAQTAFSQGGKPAPGNRTSVDGRTMGLAIRVRLASTVIATAPTGTGTAAALKLKAKRMFQRLVCTVA